MNTTDFLNKFVNSSSFDKFLTYDQGYDPDPEGFAWVHFLWETYLKETQITFVENPHQVHYVCDRQTRSIIGPYPLTIPEYVYAVFVSSLLMFTVTTVELSLDYTRAIVSNGPTGCELVIPVFKDFEYTVRAFIE